MVCQVAWKRRSWWICYGTIKISDIGYTLLIKGALALSFPPSYPSLAETWMTVHCIMYLSVSSDNRCVAFEKAKREKDTAIRDKKISIAAKSINLEVYLRIFDPIFLSLKKDVLYNFECLLIYLVYIKSLKKYQSWEVWRNNFFSFYIKYFSQIDF